MAMASVRVPWWVPVPLAVLALDPVALGWDPVLATPPQAVHREAAHCATHPFIATVHTR